MDYIHHIINILSVLVPHDPNTILTFLGSGTVVAILLQAVKHFGKLQEAKKTVMFLLGVLSFAVTYADSFLQFTGQDPKAVVGSELGWVITLAVFIHRFAVSPGYYKLLTQLDKLKTVFSNADAYRAEVSAQAVTPITAEDIPVLVPETAGVPTPTGNEFKIQL